MLPLYKSHHFKSFKQQAGFTLIEVLVVVAVSGILMIMATVIFINSIRNSQKSEITAEARENAALVIDRIQRDGRLSNSFSVSATRLIMNTSSGPVTWDCVAPGSDNGYITRTEGSAPPIKISVTNRDKVDGVSVATCGFSNPPGASNTTAQVDFTLTEGRSITTPPQEYAVNLQFSTTISVTGR